MCGGGGTWIPPIGIPRPSFGIEEQPEDFYDSSTLYVVGNFNYKIYNYQGRNIPYTHFVDNTNVNCGTGDNYGTPSVPICDIPTPNNVPEGSVILVAGGTDTQPYMGESSIGVGGSGTSQKPIFIIGIPNNPALEGKPRFALDLDGDVEIIGSYVILDGFRIRAEGKIIGFEISSWPGFQESDHIGVRNNYAHDMPFVLGLSKTAFSANKNDGFFHNNIVFFNNTVYSWGNYTLLYNPARESAPGLGDIDTSQPKFQHDMNAFGANARFSDVWVIDNIAYEIGGDGVGSGNSGAVFEDGLVHPRNVYIGRNHFYKARENAVDIKEADRVVISQNEFNNFVDSDSSDGSAIGIHEDSGTPRNTWVLYNNIHDVARGMKFSRQGSEHFAIGNVVYRCSREGIGVVRPGGTLGIQFPGANVSILNNLAYDCAVPFYTQKDNNFPEAFVDIKNNIAGGPVLSSGSSEGQLIVTWAEHLDVNHINITSNLLEPLLGIQDNVRVKWNSVYEGPFNSFPDKDKFVNTIIGDPQFTDIINDNYEPLSNLYVDQGTDIQQVLDKYEADFGVPINVDFNGNPRFVGGAIDIGPFEFQSGQINCNTNADRTPYGNCDGILHCDELTSYINGFHNNVVTIQDVTNGIIAWRTGGFVCGS